MTIYVIAIFTILFTLYFTRKIEKLRNKALFITFIILWLIAGFRDISVGTDTIAYYQYFSGVSDGSINVLRHMNFPYIFASHGYENGFQLYTLLITKITNSFTTFLLITYGFIYYSFYRFIKKYSRDYLLSMVLFITLFFFSSMNTLREALAVAVLAWSYKYIIEKRLLKFLIILLFGILIHQASILMLAAYFVYGKKITRANAVSYFAIAISVFLVIDELIYIAANFNPRYSFYIARLNSYSLGSIMLFTLYASISCLLFYLYSNYQNNRFAKILDTLKQSFYLKMIILSTLCALVAIKVNALSRTSDYFMIFSLISIPYFFSISKRIRLINSYRYGLISLLFIYCFAILLFRPTWFSVSSYHIISGFAL